MSRIFNQIVLAEPEAEELVELPDTEDFAFADGAEDDKQAAFDGSRGI